MGKRPIAWRVLGPCLVALALAAGCGELPEGTTPTSEPVPEEELLRQFSAEVERACNAALFFDEPPDPGFDAAWEAAGVTPDELIALVEECVAEARSATTTVPPTSPTTEYVPPTTEYVPPTTEFVPPRAPSGGCDPNYSPCVPLVAYDLDCDDVGGPISVLGSDPHGFDRDNDGTGCESD